MPLDAITVYALSNELKCALVGSKIDKVQQPSRDTLILSVRGNGHNDKLLLSAGSGTARVHFLNEAYENPQSPPMFCMLLRKHLVGAKILDISQPNMERMLVFDLNTYDEMGMEKKKQLIIEMMGRNSNIILTDEEGNIIDCLRRVDGDMSRVRQVMPGLIYRLPPEQEKQSFFTLSSDNREALWKNADAEKLADKWLLDSFSGLSPLTCRELCYRAARDASKPIGLFTAAEKLAFSAEMKALEQRVNNSDFEPTMLIVDEKPSDFSFMQIAQYENAAECISYTNFSTLLEDYYTKRDKQDLIKRKSQTLYKSVKSAHERTVKKLALRREELLKTENRETSRQYGDLLTANLYRINKGDRLAEIDNYFQESCPKIQIKLDELKTPAQNAAMYYKEYNKAKTAEKYLGDLIEKGEKEGAYLLSVMDELQRAEAERDLAEIRRELTETGFIKAQKTAKAEKFKETAPLRYVSSSGTEILVGKNNSQNDKLTTKTARRTDIWLHVQKIHGSHVIISCYGSQPDEVTLFEAATLAAFYSQGRDSGKIPVDFTQVRFVKKPSGSMPGAVIYTDYKTLLVTPDEKLISQLKKI
ncbi:MAG: NFACT family protein [Oscillospiraceae bacterium]|nr:NFACT family protein [Oscillospiraceae bacterium]